MKFILIISLKLFILFSAQAETLLIASADSEYSFYKRTCQTHNYLCLPDNYDKIINITKPEYNKLIEEFDLDNSSYIQNFFTKAKNIIKSEMLNIDDYEHIVFSGEKICAQACTQSQQNDLRHIKNIVLDINKITTDQKLIEKNDPDYLFYIANQKIKYNQKTLNFIQKNLTDILIIKVGYNSYEIFNEKQKYFFLNGDCHKHNYWDSNINQINMQIMPYFKNGCNFTEVANRHTLKITDHLTAHKNKYIFGLAFVLSAIILNNNPIIIEY